MKQFSEACIALFLCLTLGGCGTDPAACLEMTQETDQEAAGQLQSTSGNGFAGEAAETTESGKARSGNEETAGNGKARSGDTGTAESSEGTAASAQGTRLVVYVCGQVKHAGVYRLEAGARICDAVEAAGGMTDKASKEYWNLAEPLTDGQMLYFPTEKEAKELLTNGGEVVAGSGNTGYGNTAGTGNTVTGTTAAGNESNKAAGRVNINTAGSDELQTIPGIGETRAEAIISYREENGGFSCIEDIMKVSGIKDALFNKMKDYITVS